MIDLKKFKIKISTDEKYKILLKTCYKYSEKSNHPGTHNAALIINKDKIVLKGVNVLPPGVKHKKSRFEGKNKHFYLNHAERDVVFKAARKGLKTQGLTMVMPWLPCIPCANCVITAGIKKLIVHKQMIERTETKMTEEFSNSVKVLREAGVDIIAYDGVVGVKAYMHDKYWDA